MIFPTLISMKSPSFITVLSSSSSVVSSLSDQKMYFSKSIMASTSPHCLLSSDSLLLSLIFYPSISPMILLISARNVFSPATIWATWAISALSGTMSIFSRVPSASTWGETVGLRSSLICSFHYSPTVLQHEPVKITGIELILHNAVFFKLCFCVDFRHFRRDFARILQHVTIPHGQEPI